MQEKEKKRKEKKRKEKKGEAKRRNDSLPYIHNCTQEYSGHRMTMLQTIAIDQVKEALDQFNRVYFCDMHLFLLYFIHRLRRVNRVQS
jgi:hypothetical protein